MSRQKRPSESWWLWFNRRFLRIGFPYLFWSLVLSWKIMAQDVSRLPEILFQGKAWFHFYFFPVILQCYLLFPLFQIILRRRRLAWSLFVVLWVLELWLLGVTGLPHPWFRAYWCFPWLAYFYSGMMLASIPVRIVFNRFVVLLAAVSGFLFATAYVTWDFLTRVHHAMQVYGRVHPGNHDHFHRPSVIVLWLFACLVVVFLSRFRIVSRWEQLGADLSLWVFLVHPMIQLGLFQLDLFVNSLWNIPAVFILAVSSGFMVRKVPNRIFQKAMGF